MIPARFLTTPSTEFAVPLVSLIFFYEPDICVLCDGSVHDAPEQRAKDEKLRQNLEDDGYRIVVIRYDQEIVEQIQQFPGIFGAR